MKTIFLLLTLIASNLFAGENLQGYQPQNRFCETLAGKFDVYREKQSDARHKDDVVQIFAKIELNKTNRKIETYDWFFNYNDKQYSGIDIFELVKEEDVLLCVLKKEGQDFVFMGDDVPRAIRLNR